MSFVTFLNTTEPPADRDRSVAARSPSQSNADPSTPTRRSVAVESLAGMAALAGVSVAVGDRKEEGESGPLSPSGTQPKLKKVVPVPKNPRVRRLVEYLN